MSYMYLVIAKKYTEVIVKCALILKVTVNNSLEPVICINMSYMIIVGMCVSGKKKKKKSRSCFFLRSVWVSIWLY